MINKFYFNKTKCLAQCLAQCKSEEERIALLQDLSKIEEHDQKVTIEYIYQKFEEK